MIARGTTQALADMAVPAASDEDANAPRRAMARALWNVARKRLDRP